MPVNQASTYYCVIKSVKRVERAPKRVWKELLNVFIILTLIILYVKRAKIYWCNLLGRYQKILKGQNLHTFLDYHIKLVYRNQDLYSVDLLHAGADLMMIFKNFQFLFWKTETEIILMCNHKRDLPSLLFFFCLSMFYF